MIKGNTEPRLFTPPLRKLTQETSLGFMFIAFCKSLGQELLPWQKWLSIFCFKLKKLLYVYYRSSKINIKCMQEKVLLIILLLRVMEC